MCVSRADPREFRCCVLWLEDQRIRHYDDRERGRRLRDGGDGDKWEAGRYKSTSSRFT